jgi:hypothetical protein
MNYRGAAAAAAAAATLGGLGCACGAPCVPTPDFVKTYVAHQQAHRRAEQLFALLHLDGSGEVTWRAVEGVLQSLHASPHTIRYVARAACATSGWAARRWALERFITELMPILEHLFSIQACPDPL